MNIFGKRFQWQKRNSARDQLVLQVSDILAAIERATDEEKQALCAALFDLPLPVNHPLAENWNKPATMPSR